MAIKMTSGIYTSTYVPIDYRFILSKAEMRQCALFPPAKPTHGRLNKTIGQEEILLQYPDHYFALCSDDNKLYIFSVSNNPNNETGYFTPAGMPVVDGEEGQVLMFINGTWTSVSLPDNGSIIQAENNALSLKGYNEAEEGYTLIKSTNGLAWVAPGEAVKPDNKSIIYFGANKELMIKGFNSAADGEMLVKNGEAVAWVQACSMEELNKAVQKCNQFAIDAALAAAECRSIKNEIDGKIWFGTIDDYNQLSVVYPDVIYIITDGFYEQ